MKNNSTEESPALKPPPCVSSWHSTSGMVSRGTVTVYSFSHFCDFAQKMSRRGKCEPQAL